MAQYNQTEENRFNNQEIWQPDHFEDAVYLCSPPTYYLSELGQYKLNIRAIMPNIPIAEPIDWWETISDSMYVNDKECKLPVGSIVYLRNYLLVPKNANEHFNHKWIWHGSHIWVETFNGNIDMPKVTCHVDPSFCFSCIVEHPYHYHS